jgi:hypothetical protein
MCGKLTTRDIEAYKKGMNVCDRYVPNSGGGKSVNVHINRLGVSI